MADIIHEFVIKAPQQAVFDMFATPAGLDRWWTKESSGEPKVGASYRLYFGPGYDWRAKVTECVPGLAFELAMTDAHEDWATSKVGCKLSKEGQGGTHVLFHHTGWPEENAHWRVSNFAGQCICVCCGAPWSTGSLCRTRRGWTSNRGEGSG